MIISFSSLLPLDEKSEVFEICYENAVLDGHPVLRSDPFPLTVTHHEAHQMEVSGEGELVLEYPCDRCLSPVEVRIPLQIHRRFDTETLLDEEQENAPFALEESLPEFIERRAADPLCGRILVRVFRMSLFIAVNIIRDKVLSVFFSKGFFQWLGSAQHFTVDLSLAGFLNYLSSGHGFSAGCTYGDNSGAFDKADR